MSVRSIFPNSFRSCENAPHHGDIERVTPIYHGCADGLRFEQRTNEVQKVCNPEQSHADRANHLEIWLM